MRLRNMTSENSKKKPLKAVSHQKSAGNARKIHNRTQHNTRLTKNMNLSSPLVVVLSSVMGTVWIAAEPCANGYGKYDMVACNSCAETGVTYERQCICQRLL